MTKPRKRIALFGGSFNPPHLGHTEIVRWLFRRGIVDEVWVIPCYIHPFGKSLLPFEDRVQMLKMSLGLLSLPVMILNIEKELGGISYTSRTIEHLKKKYPDYWFSLITGGDIESQTAGWKDYDKIKDLVEIIKLPRGEGSPIPNISSTEIRRRISARESFADLVEKEVAVYIVTKGLFK